jgi:tetratricopeptide (TPR) repeat protein
VSSGFSVQEITRMLGLSPAELRAYVKAGLLCPQRGQEGELRFSFQDLLLLRTAKGLVTERLPPRRVREALRQLRRRLPSGRPLTGVQLAADGRHVVVREGDSTWRADSGQVLLGFATPAPAAGAGARAGATSGAGADAAAGPEPIPLVPIAELRRASAAAPAVEPRAPRSEKTGAEPALGDLFQLGCELEATAPEAARAAYARVLARDPGYADAHVNLGRLLHEANELALAEEHYRAALAARPGDPTALYNLGVVLEDYGASEPAVEMYEAAVAADPLNADAHYNAARLCELAGRYEAAVRHLKEYRKLTRR